MVSSSSGSTWTVLWTGTLCFEELPLPVCSLTWAILGCCDAFWHPGMFQQQRSSEGMFGSCSRWIP